MYFLENIWRRNVNQKSENNSTSNILWIFTLLPSYFQKSERSRRYFLEELLSVNGSIPWIIYDTASPLFFPLSFSTWSLPCVPCFCWYSSLPLSLIEISSINPLIYFLPSPCPCAQRRPSNTSVCSLLRLKILLASGVWTCHSFENNFGIDHYFAKYLKESC